MSHRLIAMMRNRSKLVAIGSFVLVLIVGISILSFPPSFSQPSACTDSFCTEENSPAISLTDTSVFQEITMDECLKKWANKEDGVYYFGYEDCPWCQDAVPILKETAQEQGKSVYYIRTRDKDHNLLYDERQKDELITYIGEYMEKNEEGELTLYVPMVVQMMEGTIENCHIGTVEGYEPSEREMTENEKEYLKGIFESYFVK